MKMMVTVREIFDKGLWSDFCELTGVNPYALNEGLMMDSDEVELPEKLQVYFIKEN